MADARAHSRGTPGFDWPALMRAGMRGLGLKPQEFWALTPAELQVLLGEGSGNTPLGRQRLGELMSAFPDTSDPSGAGPNRSDAT